ncbi:MAG: amidase [Dehalococcoidales bacterium]|nr:MAG: amidase [Dehalococcoidales bacterium]
MSISDIAYMPALEMAVAIREKKLSPVEVVDAILTRIDELNPKVNAYCTLLPDYARKQAKEAEALVMKGEELGPLHGVPVSVKDLVFSKSVRTTFGSRIHENFVPDEDDIVVERLKAAGAIVIGKTNTPEFGFMGVTDNLLFGATHNPWNYGRHAGGSSGGAASAVVAGMGPLAVGTDGGGSIRIPSSFCGAFGLKPSYGRVPRGPGLPEWQTLSHTGPITRTVTDAALMLEVIAGRDVRDRLSLPDTNLKYLPLPEGDLKGLKVAWSSDLGYALVDPEVLAVTTSTLSVFESLGADIEEANLELEHQGPVFAVIWAVTLASKLANYLNEWREHMNPQLVRMVERGMGISAMDYARAALAREEFWNKIQPLFERYDILLTPATAISAFDINTYQVTEIAGVKGTPTVDWTPFTYPFNFTGQPAASVPCGWTEDGLPVGLQIVGRCFDDAAILRAAAAFERAAPWAERIPPLSGAG